jgi:hypothetical protein
MLAEDVMEKMTYDEFINWQAYFILEKEDMDHERKKNSKK